MGGKGPGCEESWSPRPTFLCYSHTPQQYSRGQYAGSRFERRIRRIMQFLSSTFLFLDVSFKEVYGSLFDLPADYPQIEFMTHFLHFEERAGFAKVMNSNCDTFQRNYWFEASFCPAHFLQFHQVERRGRHSVSWSPFHLHVLSTCSTS